MGSFWILMALWAGGCVGFLAFAMMQVARHSDDQQLQPEPLTFSSHDQR